MSKQIAVDIVLIPPKEILELAIRINRTFKDTAAEDYVQDLKTCIPHVTLLMGLMDKNKLKDVAKKLDKLAKKFLALDLSIDGIDVSERPDGKEISGFRIGKTTQLQNLHEALLEATQEFFSYEGVKKEMFYSPPALNNLPNYWVQGFANTKVRENYEPHITLGFGVPDQRIDYPIRFIASDLVLCQLGNHCTCRKILAKTSLALSV